MSDITPAQDATDRNRKKADKKRLRDLRCRCRDSTTVSREPTAVANRHPEDQSTNMGLCLDCDFAAVHKDLQIETAAC